MSFQDVAGLHAAIAAVCPIVGVDCNGTIAFGLGATAAQISAAESIVASWVDPSPAQTCSVKQLVQAMHANGWDAAFATALAAATPGDRLRWGSYTSVPITNPVLGRLWAAAEPGVTLLDLYAAGATQPG